MRWISRDYLVDKPKWCTEYAVLDIPGGLITVAVSDNGSNLRLRVEYENKVEDAAAQAEQEGPLQDSEGEALPGESCVGGESPLSDAGPEKVEVVEGVGGYAKAERTKDLATLVLSLYARTEINLGQAVELLALILRDWR